MNVLSKILDSKIILISLFGSLFKKKISKPLTERKKLEKQYLDNIKW